MEAVKGRDYEYIESLLFAGYDCTVYDDMGNTPLHHSASMGDAEVCGLLITHHADIFKKNKRGQTPLHLGVLSGNMDVVTQLSDMNSNAYEEDIDGITPYNLACLHGRLEIAKYFVEECMISPNVVFGAKGNHDEVVRYMLEMGARPCERSLYYAIRHHNVHMFREFIKHFDNVEGIRYLGMSVPQMMIQYNATNIFELYESKLRSDSYISKITENLDKIVLSK
jgi:ankyrin repeat protein